MRYIWGYLCEDFRESFAVWERGEALSVLLGIVIAAVLSILPVYGIQIAFTPTTYQMVSVFFAVLFLILVLIVTPFRMWKSQKMEIKSLKGKSDQLRQDLWVLRQSGVKLRNDGKSTLKTKIWLKKYDTWRSEILSAAKQYSADLYHSLNTLDKIEGKNNETVSVDNADHQKRVSVVSEMLARLYAHLESTRR